MKICQNCQKTFQPKQNHPRYKYCSIKCKNAVIKATTQYKQKRCEHEKKKRESNLDAYREKDRLYYLNNKHKFFANNAKRRALVKQATPSWADLAEIQNVYLEAQYLQMHVDHIIPLRGKFVCGLHVWENLQLLSAKDNLSKGNKHAIYD